MVTVNGMNKTAFSLITLKIEKLGHQNRLKNHYYYNTKAPIWKYSYAGEEVERCSSSRSVNLVPVLVWFWIYSNMFSLHLNLCYSGIAVDNLLHITWSPNTDLLITHWTYHSGPIINLCNSMCSFWIWSDLIHSVISVSCVTAGDEAVCIVCNIVGNITEQLFCTSCGHHYHGNCLHPAVEVNPTVRAGWQCPDCKICQMCRYGKTTLDQDISVLFISEILHALDFKNRKYNAFQLCEWH